MNLFKKLAVLQLCFYIGIATASEALLITPTISGYVQIQSWKDLRDKGIVKQDLDYSCGAASVATILSGYYGTDVTEKDILQAMVKDGIASFSDLAAVVDVYGFKAIGVALDFQQLMELKIPAIAYLERRGVRHFSVIRGIAEDGTVLLGDPSWGNTRFSLQQFLSMWETRKTNVVNGKILLIVPENKRLHTIDKTFFRRPETYSLAKELLMLRPF
jgi:uncharacterized protein